MSNSSLWNEILSSLGAHLSEDEISQWLRPLSIGSIKSGLVVINAPNKFYKAWVEEKYLGVLKKIFKEEIPINKDGVEPEIKIVLAGENETNLDKINKKQQTGEYRQENVERPNIYSLQLDNQNTFENFVVGNSNRMAHATCIAAAKGFDTIGNPLYIYGDVGLGKTHLMQAVGNELKINFPKLRIIYTTGELYKKEYIQSIQNKTINAFTEKYNNSDVLLLDDVQGLSTGEKTQGEFFDTFTILYSNRKRIILTSNTIPSKIPELDKRLSSRFTSGMIVDIQSPSLEEREAIILKRLEIMQKHLKPEVASYLAENMQSVSVRDMIGAIISLITIAEFQNKEITPEFCQEILKDFLVTRDKTLSPDKIVEVAATFFMMKISDLKSKKRSKSIVYPRNIAMYLLREKTPLSLSEIGAMFDRDHSTVLSAIKKIEEEEKVDPVIKSTLEDVRRKMKMDNK